MEATYFDWFSLEWAKACYKMNPTDENRKRLCDVVKRLKEQKKCTH